MVSHMHRNGAWMMFPPEHDFAVVNDGDGWKLLAADMYRDGDEMEFGGWELVAPISYCPWCGEELPWER